MIQPDGGFGSRFAFLGGRGEIRTAPCSLGARSTLPEAAAQAECRQSGATNCAYAAVAVLAVQRHDFRIEPGRNNSAWL
jgi:hypothetical protein